MKCDLCGKENPKKWTKFCSRVCATRAANRAYTKRKKLAKLVLFLLLIPSVLQAKIHPVLGIGVGRMNGNTAVFPSFVGSASVGLETRKMGVEFSFNHINQVTTPALREGSLTMMPMMFNLYVAPPISKSWSLLAKGGLSYVLCNRELSEKTLQIEGYPNYKVAESIKSGVGYQFGGGAIYKANKNVRISFEILQLFFQSTIKFTRKNQNSLRDITYTDEGQIDLDTILGMVKVGYVF